MELLNVPAEMIAILDLALCRYEKADSELEITRKNNTI
jgi:hypothetical protein